MHSGQYLTHLTYWIYDASLYNMVQTINTSIYTPFSGKSSFHQHLDLGMVSIWVLIPTQSWLVGGLPLWKMMEFVSWDYDIWHFQYMEKTHKSKPPTRDEFQSQQDGAPKIAKLVYKWLNYGLW